MSAEVYFAAFLEVIGFSGCCCCANGRKSTCRRDSEKSEWFLLFTVLAEKYDRHPGVTDITCHCHLFHISTNEL